MGSPWLCSRVFIPVPDELAGRMIEQAGGELFMFSGSFAE